MALCPGAKELLKNPGHRDLSTHTLGTVIHAEALMGCPTPPGVSRIQFVPTLLARAVNLTQLRITWTKDLN